MCALAMVFMCCELGQRTSEEFEKIKYTINQSNWYLFPIEVKRMLPMIIANAQDPVALECFGSIACSAGPAPENSSKMLVFCSANHQNENKCG